MAITLVDSFSKSFPSGSSPSVVSVSVGDPAAWNVAPATGDLVVFTVLKRSSTAVTPPGNVTLAVEQTDTSRGVHIYYRVWDGTETSFTFSFPADATSTVAGYVFRSGGTSWVVDKTSSADSGASFVTSLSTGSTGSLTAAEEVAFTGLVTNGSTTGKAASGFTVTEIGTDFGVGYQLTAATTSLDGAWTWATTREAAAAIATFMAPVSQTATPDTLDLAPEFTALGNVPIIEYPTTTLEIAYGYGPFDENPVFTEVESGDFWSASWTEGRQKGLQDYPPAQATVVLRNDDRRYDPENTSGPHFGNLLPRTPVRFSARGGGTLYEQFTMFVDGGWEQTSHPPAGGTCTLRLVDMLGVIQGLPLPASPYDIEVMVDEPAAYWKLDEAQGSQVMADSSGNGRHGEYHEVALGQDPLIPDGGTSAHFENLGDWRALYRGFVLASLPSSVEFWMRAPFGDPSITASQNAIGGARTTGHTVPYWTIEIPPASGSGFGGTSNAHGGIGLQMPGNDFMTTTATVVGRRHHIVVTQTDPSSVNIYVDSEPAAVTTIVEAGTAVDVWAATGVLAIGNSVNTLSGEFGLHGEMDNVAVYPSALSAERIAAHYETGLGMWDGDTTGQRAARIAEIIGIPATYLDLDDGITVLGPAALGQGDATDYLKKLARTEQGGLFTAQWDGGKLRFESRYHRYTDTRSVTSQVTITDDNTVADAVRYEDGSLVVEPNGMASIINQAKVTWVGGTETVTTSSPYGPRGVTVDTLAPTAALARSVGEWIVAGNSEPSVRVRGLAIEPTADVNAWEAALSLRVGDRITVRRKPQNTGSAITADYWIEGKSTDVSDGVNKWRVTYSLEPAVDNNFFTWGVSVWGEANGDPWAY